MRSLRAVVTVRVLPTILDSMDEFTTQSFCAFDKSVTSSMSSMVDGVSSSVSSMVDGMAGVVSSLVSSMGAVADSLSDPVSCSLNSVGMVRLLWVVVATPRPLSESWQSAGSVGRV